MFQSIAGWSQFQNDYKKNNLQIIDNTPDEILDLVSELHEEVVLDKTPNKTQQMARRKYHKIFAENGGYSGSQIGHKFIKRHTQLI